MRPWPILLLLPMLSCDNIGVPKPSTLDLQEKCGKQAEGIFHKERWDSSNSYTSHYAQKLDRCFVQITSDTSNRRRFDVEDALEGKNYAIYILLRGSDAVKPFLCEVTLPSNEKKTCNSEDEFKDLIKVYMEQ